MADSVSNIAHILWDWNGTLFDDAQLCVEIVNEMLRARGKPAIDARGYEEAFDVPYRGYYERIGFDFAAESFEAATAEFIGQYTARFSQSGLRPGTGDLLAKLAATGYAQSVLSAMHQDILDDMADVCGVRRYFAHIVGLDNHRAASKLESGKRLVASLGCAPGQALIVGDTVHDYEVACAMGARCVLIPSGHQTREKLKGCGAAVLGSLDEILEFVSLRRPLRCPPSGIVKT